MFLLLVRRSSSSGSVWYKLLSLETGITMATSPSAGAADSGLCWINVGGGDPWIFWICLLTMEQRLTELLLQFPNKNFYFVD